MVVLTAVGSIAALTFLLASLLVAARARLYVEEDPGLDLVDDMLPRANCGACGKPGCRPFAEALVLGETEPSRCTVASESDRIRIATFISVEVGEIEKRVARLACAGGANVARVRAFYQGLSSCRAAAPVGGGGKACAWGCLGLGDCEAACAFDAIPMDAQSLPVVDAARCTACGDCVDVCPKDLLSLQPVHHRLFVQCISKAPGEEVLEVCEVGCDGCGRCAHDAPGLVRMADNLPLLDPSRPETPKALERCPTGAMVWLHEGGTQKGPSARRVIRQGARPEAPT